MIHGEFAYSTAEIEQALFSVPIRRTPHVGPAPESTTLLVVNGEIYQLEDEQRPEDWPPLTREAGVFRLAHPEKPDI